MMSRNLVFDCAVHDDQFDCPDQLVYRNGEQRYGLIVHDGGSSLVTISFCPWCGANLHDWHAGADAS